MKIVVDGIIFEQRPQGGIARMQREILPRICDLDSEVEMLLFSEASDSMANLPRHPSIDHRRIPHVRNWLRPSRLWGPWIPHLQRVSRRFSLGDGKNQIWHSSYYTMPLGWRGAVVLTVYDMVHEKFADQLYASAADDVFRRHKQRCIESANAIVCISESTRQDLLDIYQVPANRLHVAPLAHSPIFAPLRPGERTVTEAANYLLYVGDRRAHKGFDRLLETFARLDRSDGLELHVVGGSKFTSEEKHQIQELGLDQVICHHQNIDDSELRRLYANAIGAVYPSLYEGFGIPILEAMASGCAVLASRIPSSLEVAGDAALFFEPDDTADFLRGLESLLVPETTADLRAKGLERAELFSWDRTAKLILDVYRSVDPGAS